MSYYTILERLFPCRPPLPLRKAGHAVEHITVGLQDRLDL